MTYSDKLKHPMWQKKRLSIFNRDNFTCQKCGSKDKTLAVHHLVYNKAKEPWEYTNDLLLTLCCDCHEYEHEHIKNATEQLINNIKKSGMLSNEIYKLSNLSFAKPSEEYFYTLVDDNGGFGIDLPVKLFQDTIFEHNTGMYKIIDEDNHHAERQ